MKKIILISQCQFMHLAIRAVFEKKTDYTMECLSSGYEIDKECANTTILIHVIDENYSELLVLMRRRQFFWLRKSIFITQKRLAALMSYLSMKTLRFIDESASVGAFEREIVEGSGSESDVEKGELLSKLSNCAVVRSIRHEFNGNRFQNPKKYQNNQWSKS